ncbi:MAG: hypothetical protein AAGF93_08670 [Cyanobacteria bacterium P01_H01_bin.105]
MCQSVDMPYLYLLETQPVMSKCDRNQTVQISIPALEEHVPDYAKRIIGQ